MKTFYMIVLTISFLMNVRVFSWDSTAAKYMPLQVGNAWVFSGTSSGYIYYGRFYLTIKITGTVDTLGRRYYKTSQRLVQINGNSTCGIWHFGQYLRIDSVTMNFYKLENYCNSNETLIDSLKAKLNDTTIICSNSSYTRGICIDTSSYNIFNNNFPAKNFSALLGPSIGAIYAKGLGIVRYGYGYQMNQCYDSLKGCVINGILYGDTNTVVGINQINSEIPNSFSLSQNYPNPFNPQTNIKFQISKSGIVKLIIFDVLGEEIQALVNQELSPGAYSVDFDGSNLPSGVYYYRLESNSLSETKKMVLIK